MHRESSTDVHKKTHALRAPRVGPSRLGDGWCWEEPLSTVGDGTHTGPPSRASPQNAKPGSHHQTEIYTLKEHSPEAELMSAIYQGGAKTPPSPSALAVSPCWQRLEVHGWILKPESTPPITRTGVFVKTQALMMFFSPTHLPATGFCTCHKAANRTHTNAATGQGAHVPASTTAHGRTAGRRRSPGEMTSIQTNWATVYGFPGFGQWAWPPRATFSRAWGPSEGPLSLYT